MVIRYISAGDRLNYGDLLFPIIFDRYFSQSYRIEYYGIVESDFTTFSAIPTRSYKDLKSDIDEKEDVVVIGGGEVFFGKWRNLYSYIYPFYSKIIKFKILNKVDETFNLNKLFLYRTKYEYPFVPNFECESIYISAGGQFSPSQSKKDTEYIKRLLNRSPLLSVRDFRTFRSLTDNGVKSEIIPDSAVLISKVFSNEEIRTNVRNEDLFTLQENQYIFLQIGKFKGPRNLDAFINNINDISHRHKLSVVCCAIGNAPGHEDHIILEKLCKKEPDWKLVQFENIYEIMYLISNAKLYIGTSLHGLITAFSFLKPAIALNKRLLKLDSFISTWCSEFYTQPIDYDELHLVSQNVFKKWDLDKASDQLKQCQNKVENYFQRINIFLNNKNK